MQEGFQKEQKVRALGNSRIAAVFAAIAIMLFSPLDLAVYPDYFFTFFSLRLGVVFISLVLFFITYLPLVRGFGQEIGTIQYIVTALSVVLMIHFSEGYLSPYYAGINVILIVFLAILPMDHLRAGVICGVIYASYLIPILYRGQITEWSVFINNNAFLLATIILSILSSYMHTRLRIREYAARHELATANEDLKHLDVLKSQFFANVSHEVRTPLTSIIGPVQSIYQGDVGEITSEQKELLSQVYRNTLRLLDMINQMLDFARYDAKKMQVNLAEVDLEKTVYETVTAFREVAARKTLYLKFESVDLPLMYLDREKVDRILTNLVRNAIKFTESGGISLTIAPEGSQVVISVADTGIGIPQDRLSTIFERFQQVDSSSTRRYEGTGLGLTIVKEAVEIQHGTIEVASELGRGTTFTVRLPMNLDKRIPDAKSKRRGEDRRQYHRRNDQAPYTGPERRNGPRRGYDLARIEIDDLVFIDSSLLTSNEGSPELPAEAKGSRVLYVEDNTDLRSYVYRMLTKAGYQVETAIDGQEGWEKVASFNPEVVVSDIMMPRMDGYELLSRIQADAQFQSTPVILTTAKSELDERIHGLEEGADDYLAKPINIRELDARIRNLVTRSLFQEATLRAKELEHQMRELAVGFSRSLDLRDHYTADHSNDVLAYGTMIAAEMGLSVDEVFRNSLLLHDVGKIGVPDRILLKEGPLTDEEWETMKRHAEFGAQLLSGFDSFKDVAEIVLSHQEHFDGSGYPRGLRGTEIPQTARIIAVADAWHAMIEDRPYRKALEKPRAISELVNGKGKYFDPEVVDAFLKALGRQGRPTSVR